MRRVGGLGLLVVALAACSTSSPQAGPTSPVATSNASSPAPQASATPSAQQRYLQAVLADRPAGFWTLGDVSGVVPGNAVADASAAVADGTVVEGPIASTAGPAGAPAARFAGQGRIVTPLVRTLLPGRPFSLEFYFRADDCSRHWTQVVGTAAYDGRGRQGVNVLHYPRFFSTSCHLAVEFWKDNHYTGGCGPSAVTTPGRWLHFAATYDGRAVRCYANGQAVHAAPVTGFGVGAAFGIGGAGSGYAGTLDSGSLADVAVYPRVLPAAVILRHARAARA